MKLLAVILPFAALAGACAAQGCYQFSGSNITLQVNITAIDTTSMDGGTTIYLFNSDNALTLNGTTLQSGTGESGTATITYLSGLGTTFSMSVPTSTTGFWNVTLNSAGDTLPSLTLPAPSNFPPISDWSEGATSSYIKVGSEKNAPTYAVTSVGACTGTLPTGGGSGGTTSSTPTITAVQDAGSYTAQIAQGSVFVVKGTNLSASGYTAESYPLPAADQGVSINFTPSKGGTAIQAYLVYLYNENGVNQLAAILPSSTPTGTYKVTVATPNGTSAALSTTVVATKPELITQDSSGSGLVVVQNYVSATELDVNRFSTGVITGGITISPAHPGQTEIAWLTGMGPASGGDNVASPGYNFAANGVNVQVYVAGMAIPAAYAGRAPGLAGTDQINFTLPANVTTGCTVPFQVDEGGVLSQTTFISIAPNATATSCALVGYTTAQLQALDNGAVVTGGGFSVFGQTGMAPNITPLVSASVQGNFLAYSGFEIAGAPVPGSSNPQGCTVAQSPAPPGTTAATGVGTALDAGTITITGPTGTLLNNTALTETKNDYSYVFQGQNATVNGQLSRAE